MHTVEDVHRELDDIDWQLSRDSATRARGILRRLADDRPLLTDMVEAVPNTPELMGRCEHHPLMSRMVLADRPGGWCLRLHRFEHDERDLIPHTHRRAIYSHILLGGYLQAWHRRTDGKDGGPFTTADLVPAVISIEEPGADYMLGDPLIHQTIMRPGTVSLFLSGPARQDQWWPACDLNGMVTEMKKDDMEQVKDFSMTPAHHAAFAAMLRSHGIITGRTEL
ncbi:hypothetical protein AB0O91_30195 [Kitasatospora sp. NPDC089797]|uniref:hypothetical protein n=1 Tax=Kitasatospora sp. NPDC089797 TaxID=3155298 RepID=UPI003427D54C